MKKKVRAFVFSFHRIAGTIISLFFLMWTISGLVLVYHPFPNVSQTQINENMDALPDSLADIRTLLSQQQIPGESVSNISLKNFQNQTLFSIKTKDSLYTICAETGRHIKPITAETIEGIAKKWVNSPVVRLDTLYERDQWIMYTRYLNEMPIYKLYFTNPEKQQLYISSKTGEVLQFTDKAQRIWAWLGAIPHKFYFPFIRQHTDAWITILTVSGFIALAVALSGLFVGISVSIRRYRVKRNIIPYKKFTWKWHHILGLTFGIFAATWALSGAMALQRIPQWIIKTHGDYRVSSTKMRGQPLSLDTYILDYRSLTQQYADIKSVEWSHFQDTPVYNIIVKDSAVCIDASTGEVKELYLPQSQIEKAISHIHKNNEAFTVTLIDQYEEYYLPRKRELPLPAYKVEVDNADKSRYYIDPKSGNFHYLNKSRKAKKWLYSGLHYLHIKWLVERPVLWTIVIWALCIGVGLISLSGVWMGIKYTVRRIRKMNR